MSECEYLIEYHKGLHEEGQYRSTQEREDISIYLSIHTHTYKLLGFNT